MTERAPAGRILLEHLRPEVLHLSRAGFRLGDDLERLAQVVVVEAPEATVFYAARILEALTALEVEALTGETPKTLHSSLVRLEDAGHLSPSRLLYFHSLRILGNEARHIWRSLASEDAILALGLLERFLVWHFREFALGPRASLVDGDRSFIAIDPSFLDALSLMEDPAGNLSSLRAHWTASDGVLRRVGSFAALYVEALISVKRADEALQVADEALAGLGGAQKWASTRLRQLRGHALREVGRADESARELEALRRETPDDEETLGILGGTYKVMWRDERRGKRERERFLHDSAALYRRAFAKTGGTYSGINAATMSLLDGDAAQAAKIAGAIVALYEARRGRLAPGAAIAFSGYFDCVTLAEALLLSGRLDESRRLYFDAFQRHAELTGHIDKTRQQMQMLLEHLDLGADPDAFLAQKTGGSVSTPYSPKPMDTAGVPLREDLREAIERIAEQVHDIWAEKRLAEGWRYGPARDDAKKEHPDLVPYADLPETEKEYDRASARETVRALVAMGYRIER